MALVWFLLVIGALVLAHEFGHFFIAKRGGIKVIEFAFGFGPRLIKIQRGETLYSVRLLPLGGFCRFLSVHELDDDLAEGRLSQEEYDRLLPRAFERKSFGRRFGVLVAGAVLNFVLGAVLFVLVFTVWGAAEATGSNVIANVIPTYPAGEAGLEDGDRILSVNETETPKWEDVLAGLVEAQEATLQIEKPDGSLHDVLVSPYYDREDHEIVVVGMEGDKNGSNVVAKTRENLPAARAGVVEGDRIVAVNGVPTSDWNAVTEAMTTVLTGTQATKEVRLHVQRKDGGVQDVSLTPKYDATQKRSILGMGNEYVMKQVTPWRALQLGAMRTVDFTVMLFSALLGLFSGKGAEGMGGAITLARQIGDSAQGGMSELVFMMGALSLQFGILNLLPLPALDGGQLVVISYEKIRGRELKLEVKWYIQMVGLVLLTGLMVLLLFKDILDLFPG